MSKINNYDIDIGFLFSRKDAIRLSIPEFINIQHQNIFELTVLQQSITEILHHRIDSFDAAVGDWKCQIRTSMIIDLLQDHPTLYEQLSDELLQIQTILEKLNNKLFKISHFTHIQNQQFKEKLKITSLYDFFQEYNIDYKPSKSLVFLGLCYITNFKNDLIPLFNAHSISKNKMKFLINLAKTNLCQLSINYEHNLIQKYELQEELQLAQQIETKEIVQMTALFSSIKAILRKMSEKKQLFLIQKITFCKCHKVRNIHNAIYKYVNGEIKQQSMDITPNTVVTVIETYQYSGNLSQLQNALYVSTIESDIPQEYYEKCDCLYSFSNTKKIPLHLSLLAFFAQHPQFTNGAAIDFEGLGLMNSDLKKEYDYLLTLPGFSREDMSVFHINHMYASTIQEVLQSTQKIEAKMRQKQANNRTTSSIIPRVANTVSH